MNFEQSREFQKEFKRLGKKYRSLKGDLVKFQRLVAKLDEPVMQYFFEGNRATKLVAQPDVEVVKARLDCADLGNKQLLRIVYIKRGDRVLFVELYAKNDKPREDKLRIKRYLA